MSNLNPPLIPTPWYPGINLHHPLADGLIAFYPCWEGSGQTLGNFNQIRRVFPTTGSISWVDSSIGTMVTTSTFFQMSLPSFFTSLSEHSWAAFIYPSTSGRANQYVAQYATSGTSEFLGCYFSPPNTIVFEVEATLISQSMSANQWHMVAMTVSHGLVRCYVDGVQISSPVSTTNNAVGPVYLMAKTGNNGTAFAGGVSGFKFWKRALGASEIFQHSRDPWALTRQPTFSVPFSPQIISISGSGGAIASGTFTSTNTFNQTGSGGAIASGLGVSQANFNPTSSGGAIVSGAANVNVPGTFVGSGGVIVSGAAPVLANDNVTGTGGTVAGGSGPPNYVFNPTPASGALAAGTVITNAVYAATAGGGAVAAGVSTVSIPYTLVGTGGAIVSGTGSEGGTNDLSGTGGTVGAGTASANYVFNPTPASGALVGGTSTPTGAFAPPTSGGVIAGGVANVIANFSGTGGALASGAALLTSIWQPTASGGVVAAGSGPDTQTFVVPASGGAVVGGQTSPGYGFNVLGTGGAVCAGHLAETKDVPVGGGVLCSGSVSLDFIYRNHVEQVDINLVYSGGVNNSDPSRSLGGVSSVIGIPDKTDNLFGDVLSTESTFGSTEYRAFYVFNDNERGTMYNTKVWIDPSLTITSISIAVGPIDAVATEIGVKNNPPADISFSSPAAEADALLVGTVRPLDGFYVWMRRTVIPGTPSATDDSVFFHLSATDSP